MVSLKSSYFGMRVMCVVIVWCILHRKLSGDKRVHPEETTWFVFISVCAFLSVSVLSQAQAVSVLLLIWHGQISSSLLLTTSTLEWAHIFHSRGEKLSWKAGQFPLHTSVQKRRARWTKLQTSYVMAYNFVCPLCTQMISPESERLCPENVSRIQTSCYCTEIFTVKHT